MTSLGHECDNQRQYIAMKGLYSIINRFIFSDNFFSRYFFTRFYFMNPTEFLITYWYYVLAFLVTGFLFIREVFDYAPKNAMTPFEATALINRKRAGVVDVRDVEAFKAGHLPSAVHIPLDQLGDRYNELKKYKNKKLLVIAERNNQASSAVKLLEKSGFSDVYMLNGGMEKWKTEGLPVTV